MRKEGTKANRFGIQKEILALCPPWFKEAPYKAKQMGIDDACQAVKLAKRKFKKTGQFCRVEFRKKRDREDSFYAPKQNITEKGVFHTSGGLLHFSEEVADAQFDCRLVRKAGRMFLCKPETKPVKTPENQRLSMVAVDPGVRTFATFWALPEAGKIGEADFGRIHRLCLHMDRLLGKAAKAPCAPKRRMRRAAERMRWKIKDLVGELHHKTAVYLCRKTDCIAIPEFKTSQMVSKLHSKVARSMLTWAHYRFQQFLKAKAEEYSVSILQPCEAYTSKTCSYCGTVRNIGSASTWKCKCCGIQHDRDENGARGIYLRALGDSPTQAPACAHS